MLDSVPGEKIKYSSWKEQLDGLGRLVQGARRVAMQYSPQCAIPYVSMVDAGTVELVRSLGVEVASSAELIQYFEARWNQSALNSHLEAGRRVDRMRREVFQMIGERTRNVGTVAEVEAKNFVSEGFAKAVIFTGQRPIVGGEAKPI